MNIHFVKSNCNNIDNFTTIQNNKNKNIEIAKIIYNTKTEKEDLSFTNGIL